MYSKEIIYILFQCSFFLSWMSLKHLNCHSCLHCTKIINLQDYGLFREGVGLEQFPPPKANE